MGAADEVVGLANGVVDSAQSLANTAVDAGQDLTVEALGAALSAVAQSVKILGGVVQGLSESVVGKDE